MRRPWGSRRERSYGRTVRREVGVDLDHLVQHILVAHLGPDEHQTHLSKGELEPEIAHGRRHDIPGPEPALFFHEAGEEEEGVVPVQQPAPFVHPERPVRVAVIGDAHVGLHLEHPVGEILRIKRSAAGVDVLSVGRVVDGNDMKAQLLHDLRATNELAPLAQSTTTLSLLGR